MQPESSVKRLLRCLCTDQSITDLNQSLTVFHSEDVIVNLLVCVWTQILTNRTDRDSPVTQSDTSSCRFSLLLPSTPELVVLLEPLHSVLQKVSSRAAAP